MPVIGLTGGFVFVAACIGLVTALVVLPMREAAAPPAPGQAAGAPGLRAAGREMARFSQDALRSFLGTRAAFAGLAFALLPAGAMSLGLALQSNLAVELGMDDDAIAWLSLWTQVVSAAFMVIGGLLSDRLGRRRTLAVYLALTAPPVLYMAAMLSGQGWVMPVPEAERASRAAAPLLVTALWVATLGYAVANGLMYGTRSAIFMDVTDPKVAATQFTAYMAMMNVAISYSATWQGIAIEALGYPATLLIDATLGLLCIALLPFMRVPAGAGTGAFADGGAAARARMLCGVLAAGCLAWTPLGAGWWQPGSLAPMVDTVFTLVFVGAAVFLATGARAVGGRLGSAGLALAPLLLAMYARRWWPDLPLVYTAVPLLAAAVLAAQARQGWEALRG